MCAVGIIVEFNPFHNGHGVHLAESREISGRRRVVAVMSGNFVQRGEPALCDKWRRTKMALLAGVDIVIELPLPYVIGGADYFARGSVGLLAATGIVDALSFGSECGDLEVIKAAGKVLAEEPPAYKEALRSELSAGKSFAAARGLALERILAAGGFSLPEGLLTKPNNGLAMEYCKAVCLPGNPMEIFTTHRISGGPSATKIRRAFRNGESVRGLLPDFAHEILVDAPIASLDDFSDIFKYLVYRGDCKLSEGLGNRFQRLCGEHRSISNLLSAVKTKRYTFTRLQRTVLGVILGVTPPEADAPYIRVLGFRKDSSDLLGRMTKKASLPVITSGAALDEMLSQGGAAGKMLSQELEAGDIYRLASGAGGGFRSERGVGVVVV
ncbi:MAG: nucleotidyltransferase family protein [Defluviitaleaceae bacterium]|nr:nucleotidyltransferase family protein [Defluviitaleaceae bacterium]